MSNETPQKLIDSLETLLDRERKALTSGELDQLGGILAQKETLIERLNALDAMEQTNLSQVRDKVTRNQDLLNSALEGIRAVANRMSDLQRVRHGLETYDETGRKSQFSTLVQSKVEKRA